MNCSLRTSLTLSAVLVSSSCTDDLPIPPGWSIDSGLSPADGGSQPAIVDSAVAQGPVLPAECPPLESSAPSQLSCTGLYGAAGTGPAEKAVHAANREFMPSTQLWTDGADKRRWIALPAGTQIDTSNPNAWRFPDGTRIWKEFAFSGKRAETRFMYKVKGDWRFATYKWNETDTDALSIEQGADVPLVGRMAHAIPKKDQCTECHVGSTDKVLGFQQVLLGLPDATGLTLSTLVAEQRLSHPPTRTRYVIPDDGTGMSAKAIPWLHSNCGVSCHNETIGARANSSKMFLRIDPATFDNPSTSDWNTVKLTVGVPTVTPTFLGGLRIVPGAPDQSILLQAAQTRGGERQMPPLGTRIVDPEGIKHVREWIARLGGGSATVDGGTADAAGVDAASSDAGSSADAATIDAALPDAQPADAAEPDGDTADAEVDAEVDAEIADAEPADAEPAPDQVDAEVAVAPAS